MPQMQKNTHKNFLNIWHDGDQTSDIAVNAILPKISDED